MNADQADVIDLFMDGKFNEAKKMMRKLVNADIGFEGMAKLTNIPSKSIHRMLSDKGSPTSRNLFSILRNIK